jgi:hypothetical protein
LICNALGTSPEHVVKSPRTRLSIRRLFAA